MFRFSFILYSFVLFVYSFVPCSFIPFYLFFLLFLYCVFILFSFILKFYFLPSFSFILFSFILGHGFEQTLGFKQHYYSNRNQIIMFNSVYQEKKKKYSNRLKKIRYHFYSVMYKSLNMFLCKLKFSDLPLLDFNTTNITFIRSVGYLTSLQWKRKKNRSK